MNHAANRFLGALGIILHALLLVLAVPPFVKVNHLAAAWPLYIYIGLAVLCVLPWRWQTRWWPASIIGLMAAAFVPVYLLFPGRGPLSAAWLPALVGRFQDSWQSYFMRSSATVPPLLSLVLILAVVALLTILYVRYHIWPVTLIVIVLYLCAVNIFNGDDLTVTILQLFLTAVVLALVGQLQKQRLRWPVVAVAAVIAAAAGGALQAAGAPHTTLSAVTTPLVDNTALLRSELNTAGFFQSLERFGAGDARTGFSEDDTDLGGPLFDDNSVVFTATDYEDHYWRVETKDEYTGRGWIASLVDQIARLRALPTPLPAAGMTAATAKTKHPLTMAFTQASDYVPLPYGQLTLDTVDDQQRNIFIGWAPSRNRLITGGRMRPFAGVRELTGTYQKYQYTISQLENTTNPTTTAAPNQFKADLALPKSVTQRTRRLALSLTNKAASYYGQVTAIRDYLRDGIQFVYSKVDTPRTPKGRDYVDYFLFSSKTGYCDNFSSAMVVLLRSAGIPARWAKGFNGGNQVGSVGGGRYEYEILNSAAHSWPEVYFQGIGWVPFEPTPGFINPDERQQASQVNADQSPTAASASSSSASSSSAAARRNGQQAASSSSVQAAASTSTGTLPWPLIAAAIAAGLLIIGAGLAFWQRRRLQLRWTQWRLQRAAGKPFAAVFRHFDRQARRWQTRPAGETLARYYTRLTERLGLAPDALAPVVENAEYLLYSGTNAPAPTVTAAELTAMTTALAAMQPGKKKES